MRTFALTAAALLASGSAFAGFTPLDKQSSVLSIDLNPAIVGNELSQTLAPIDMNNDGELTRQEVAMLGTFIPADTKFAIDQALRFQPNYKADKE